MFLAVACERGGASVVGSSSPASPGAANSGQGMAGSQGASGSAPQPVGAVGAGGMAGGADGGGGGQAAAAGASGAGGGDSGGPCAFKKSVWVTPIPAGATSLSARDGKVLVSSTGMVDCRFSFFDAADGHMLWSRAISKLGGECSVRDGGLVSPTDNGAVVLLKVVGAHTIDGITIDAAGATAMYPATVVAHLDSNGLVTWAHVIGTTLNPWHVRVAAIADDRFVVTGMHPAGTPLAFGTHTLDATADPRGFVAVVGLDGTWKSAASLALIPESVTVDASGTGFASFLSKATAHVVGTFDVAGNIPWTTTLGDPAGGATISAEAMLGSEGVFAGELSSKLSLFPGQQLQPIAGHNGLLVRFAPPGLAWAHVLDGVGNHAPRVRGVFPNGHFLVTTQSAFGQFDNAYGVMFWRYRPDGSWQINTGLGPCTFTGVDAAVVDNEHIVVVSSFEGGSIPGQLSSQYFFHP